MSRGCVAACRRSLQRAGGNREPAVRLGMEAVSVAARGIIAGEISLAIAGGWKA